MSYTTNDRVRAALLAYHSGDMDWDSQDEELMRIALASAYPTLTEEVERLREAIKPAYLGLLVLKTMCRKARLEGGVEATESALKSLVEAMPELPAISALRSAPAPLEITPEEQSLAEAIGLGIGGRGVAEY